MIEQQLDSFYHHSRAVVDRILERYQWRLLERETFVYQVATCLASGEVLQPWPAAIYVYCQTLHAVCADGTNEERQTRGFVELQQYLYELSFREVPDLPADLRLEAINETLFRVWKKLPQYRKPSAFLANAAMEMRNVVRPLWTRPIAWLSLDIALEQPSASVESDPLAEAVDHELQRQVRHCFDQALRASPRARQQLEAVWLKYIVGYDDDTISNYMNKPVAHIHVLRSRGLKRLRQLPCWQQTARDFGIDF